MTPDSVGDRNFVTTFHDNVAIKAMHATVVFTLWVWCGEQLLLYSDRVRPAVPPLFSVFHPMRQNYCSLGTPHCLFTELIVR